MLDLGHEHDWFSSSLIVSFGVIAVLGFILFLIWEMTDQQPVVNLRVFRHRGFTVSVLALAFGFGAFLAVSYSFLSGCKWIWGTPPHGQAI